MITQDRFIVLQSKERCTKLGIDPTAIPAFSQTLSPHCLLQKISSYEEILDVIRFFIKKFLSAVEGTPFLVIITDEKGYVLQLKGDSSIINTVNQLGIKDGVRFIEEEAGVNSISLALQYHQPIQLIGDDHFFEILHGAACYTVPFYQLGEKQPLGTITLMTTIPYTNSLFLAMLGTVVDSIERELQVRKKNKQLRILNQVLIKTSYQAIIVTNVEGDILDSNDRGKQILQTLCPAKTMERFNIIDVREIGFYFQTVLSKQEESIGNEIELGLDGDTHYFILDIVPIFDDNRSFISVVGRLRDISEMKKTDDLLRNAEKLSVVGQLAAGVAHEIRNPLTTIKGLLQLSKSDFQPDHYDLLMSEIDRMNFIVSEFLVLGKPHVVHYEVADFRSILNDILNIFQTQAIMNGISISKEIRSNGYIHCDPNQIKQVFMNILKNAMEAMPYGGSIHVVADILGTMQSICFKDDGAGMTEEVLKKLGQPFCSTKKHGNGLGIMVTKKIIDAHKGKIHFKSQPNVGTTVEVCLPLTNI